MRAIAKKLLGIRTFTVAITFALVLSSCFGGGGSSSKTNSSGGPSVTSTTPTVSASGVAVNTTISAVFSTAMNSATLSTSTFTLNNGFSGTVTYSGNTATFTPSSSLAPSTIYTATITTGAKDASGNALASAYVWSFTTAANSTGTSSLIPVPATIGNEVPLVVDAGPVTGASSVNVGYVSVTVCPPGTAGVTAACQTIDHVTLDTGSYGLRLLNTALASNLSLPPVRSTNGQAIGECVQFVVGSIWGSVRMADIYLGGEIAYSVPIHDIGDSPGSAPAIPADCLRSGVMQDTLATLGSNGILGVGPFINDCDACLTQVIPAAYYTCTSTGCTNSMVSSAHVVRNPIASFAQDNNGVLINLPSVGSIGSAGVTGKLIFGIGTQTNNALNTASVYAVDINGNFKTTYKNVILNSSYLDSGSNGLFFIDSSIPTCPVTTWAYCPTTSPLSLSATNTSATGSTGIAVTSPTPTIVNADTLFTNSNIVAGNIGGPGSSVGFAWGLPFFYGRTVFTAISGVSATNVQAGPFWAY